MVFGVFWKDTLNHAQGSGKYLGWATTQPFERGEDVRKKGSGAW
jgi:hypothetical protein